MDIGYQKNLTSTSEPMLVRGYTNIVVQVAGKGGAAGTIKFAGSLSDVDYTQAASADNPYEFVNVIDLQDGASIDGDTGVTFSGNDVRLFEINANALNSVGLVVNATAGSFDVKIMGTN